MRNWELISRDVTDLSHSDKYGPYFRLCVLPTKTGMHPFWEGQFRLSQDWVFDALCIYPLEYPPITPRFKILRPPITWLLHPDPLFKHVYPDRRFMPNGPSSLHLKFPNEGLLCLDNCICTFYPADASWVAGQDSIVTLFNFTVYFLASWIRYVRSGYDPKAWPMQESPHTHLEILRDTPPTAPYPYECGKPFGKCHAPILLERFLTQGG